MEQHEGEKYLELLGLSHLAGECIPSHDIPVRDFLDICGEHARPMLVGLEKMGKDHPAYEATRSALRSMISNYVTVEK